MQESTIRNNQVKSDSAARFHNLKRSQLARTFVLMFLGLALVESLFFGIIYADIMASNKAAKSQFDMVKTSQQICEVCLDAREAWQARVIAVYVNPSPQTVAIYEQTNTKFNKAKDLVDAKLAKLGLGQEKIDRSRELTSLMEKRARATISAPKEKFDELEIEFKEACLDCARMLVSEMKFVHRIVTPGTLFLFGINPLNVTYIDAGINVLFLALAALYFVYAICSPISKLAADCQRIRKAELLDPPRRSSTEIAALQESFYQMSLTVAENDKRKRNYLEFLQEVQTASLIKVGSWLESVELSATASLSEQGIKLLSSSRTNIGTLVRLLNSMSASLEARENLILNKSPYNLNKLLQEAAASVDSLLQQRNIRLVVKSQLTDTDEIFNLDPSLIGRVLSNLLSNAIKYSPENSDVRVDLLSKDAKIYFKVSDCGPGLTLAQQSVLFKKYSQVTALDGIKRCGTGLGLAICKDIVEAHSGKIACDSEPGKGSCFWFSLPQPKQKFLSAKAEIGEVPSEGQQGAINGAARDGGSGSSENDSTKAVTGKSEGQVDNNEKYEGYRSIKVRLIGFLLLFLATQIVVFGYLLSAFYETSTRTNQYKAQKEKYIMTEMFYGHFLIWGQKTQIALQKNDFAAILSNTKLLKELAKKTSELQRLSDPKSEIAQKLQKMRAKEQILLDLVNDTMTRSEFQSMTRVNELGSDLPRRLSYARDVAWELDQILNRVFTLEKGEFEASFEWSQQLRTNIQICLALAAVADLIIIILYALSGINVASRVAALINKTEEFSRGKELSLSLAGRDELSILDLSLCTTAAAIRADEVQRQQLMAVINHDLRTPLASVLGSLEIINAGMTGKLEESQRNLLIRSEHALEHLLNQVNDLLLIEKIASGTLKTAKDKVIVGDLIEELFELSDTKCKAKQLTLIRNEDDPINETSLKSDRQMLKRLLSVLLSNAMEASPEGGAITVSLVQSQTDKLSVEVVDKGPGIREELRPQIFERFRQLDGKPLAGLGLALASRLAPVLGASVSIRSTGNEGTVMCLELPITQPGHREPM